MENKINKKVKSPLINTKLNDSKFKLKIGLINQKIPNILFVTLGCWIKYNGEESDYTCNSQELVNKVKNKFMAGIKKINIPNNNIMFNYKVMKVLAYPEKPFRVGFEFTIKQNQNEILNTKQFKEKIQPMIDDVIRTIENNCYVEVVN